MHNQHIFAFFHDKVFEKLYFIYFSLRLNILKNIKLNTSVFFVFLICGAGPQ